MHRGVLIVHATDVTDLLPVTAVVDDTKNSKFVEEDREWLSGRAGQRSVDVHQARLEGTTGQWLALSVDEGDQILVESG